MLEHMAGTWRRLVPRLAVWKPNAALAWWRQMPFWNVNLWRRMPIADRVNLGLGGTSASPTANKPKSVNLVMIWPTG